MLKLDNIWSYRHLDHYLHTTITVSTIFIPKFLNLDHNCNSNILKLEIIGSYNNTPITNHPDTVCTTCIAKYLSSIALKCEAERIIGVTRTNT